MNKKMMVLASALFFALFTLNTTIAVAAVSDDVCIELAGDCDKCSDKNCKGCDAKGEKKEASATSEGPAKKACCSHGGGSEGKASCSSSKESAPEKAETSVKSDNKKK
jgi:hypothetical protein